MPSPTSEESPAATPSSPSSAMPPESALEIARPKKRKISLDTSDLSAMETGDASGTTEQSASFFAKLKSFWRIGSFFSSPPDCSRPEKRIKLDNSENIASNNMEEKPSEWDTKSFADNMPTNDNSHTAKSPGAFARVPKELRVMIFKLAHSTEDAMAFQRVDRVNKHLLTQTLLMKHFLPLQEDRFYRVVERYCTLSRNLSLGTVAFRSKEMRENSSGCSQGTLQEIRAFIWTHRIKARLRAVRDHLSFHQTCYFSYSCHKGRSWASYLSLFDRQTRSLPLLRDVLKKPAAAHENIYAGKTSFERSLLHQELFQTACRWLFPAVFGPEEGREAFEAMDVAAKKEYLKDVSDCLFELYCAAERIYAYWMPVESRQLGR